MHRSALADISSERCLSDDDDADFININECRRSHAQLTLKHDVEIYRMRLPIHSVITS